MIKLQSQLEQTLYHETGSRNRETSTGGHLPTVGEFVGPHTVHYWEVTQQLNVVYSLHRDRQTQASRREIAAVTAAAEDVVEKTTPLLGYSVMLDEVNIESDTLKLSELREGILTVTESPMLKLRVFNANVST
uniref:Uncharacterized protein n=1 Tax=Lygus hesperus TaxID=30085 RepID=A0A146MGZ0_LYGHE